MQTKLQQLVAGMLLLIYSASIGQFPVLAQSESASEKTIQELQSKINELQGQEDSLAKQIKLIDSEVSVTELRVGSIEAAVSRLGQEIDELANEIVRLEELLTRRSELVLHRIPESYKRKAIPMVASLFLSEDFADFIHRVKYISTVQEDDVRLLVQLKAAQNSFTQRKDLRETKRLQQEELKAQLEKERKDLEAQRKQKQSLLDQTRSSEAVYQRLLAQALAERQALERALVEGVKVGPIKAGDPIALVGNTGYPGCSSGAHLHYEIRRNGGWINAQDFLTPREVRDDQVGGRQNIGSGSWPWPLEGDIVVTQHYGKTPYSWRYSYSGGIHTGVDMYSTSSEVIRAPKDGTLFSSSQNCGSSSVIKIKYIDHGEGLVSFYLHVK